MKKSKVNPEVSSSDQNKYLRLLAQIEIRKMFAKEDGTLKIGEAARFLNSAGFTPTEIAGLLGKQKATEVAPYIYKKNTAGK